MKAAIDEAVPAHVLTAALYERFSSRGDADFADKLLSAMRFMSSAVIWKNPANEEDSMNVPDSDALVFFGASGDLAYKKVFPSLQTMVKQGHLDVPVIGVAKAGWNVDQLRARARDGVEKLGGGWSRGLRQAVWAAALR